MVAENEKLRTKKPSHRLVPGLLALACVLRAAGAGLAVEVSANLDRNTIYLGTQTLLVVEVVDPTTPAWPTVAPVDGLRIQPHGQPGVVHDLLSGSSRMVYRFLVDPARIGQFSIPSVTLGSGPTAITRGPFTLLVREAALKFMAARIEPEEMLAADKATISVTYRGVRPGLNLAPPQVDGLTFRVLEPLPVQVIQPEGIPVSTYRLEVMAARLGVYDIKGIVLDGVPAGSVKLTVSPFVVGGTQVSDASIVVGEQTTIRVLVRGLPASSDIKLIAPPGLKIEPGQREEDSPAGAAIFAFQATPTEPGSPVISKLQLADGSQVSLPKPINLSVRVSGEGDILLCRGTPRSRETVLGEPFIVDYEVFFRGNFQAAGLDLTEAEFANRPYIRVEPVTDMSYPDWSGQPFEIGWSSKGRMFALAGNGELNGHKEQLLRFALKITPLAAGDLDLGGACVVLRLLIEQRQSNNGMFFQSRTVKNYVGKIDTPGHRVVDPPGQQQPAGYRGTVGQSLVYTTALDRTTATAMSPLTLTLKIAGEGVGPQLKPPALAEIHELTHDFDVSSTVSGGEMQGNAITFTQVVRPRSETVKELPALPLVYYDYLKKKYETIYSLPIPISVAAGSLVGATDMKTNAGPQNASPNGGAARQDGAEAVLLGANHDSLGELATAKPLRPGTLLAILAAGPCAILAVWAGHKWYNYRRPIASARRQRRDLRASLNGMAKRDDFYVGLAYLLQAYLRMTFGLPPGELSTGTLTHAMAGRRVDDDLRKTIEDLLTRCDTGRFASTGADAAEKTQLLEQTRRLLDRLDKVI